MFLQKTRYYPFVSFFFTKNKVVTLDFFLILIKIHNLNNNELTKRNEPNNLNESKELNEFYEPNELHEPNDLNGPAQWAQWAEAAQ